MILKVQLSLHSADDVERVLVYNEDRSVWFETPRQSCRKPEQENPKF